MDDSPGHGPAGSRQRQAEAVAAEVRPCPEGTAAINDSPVAPAGSRQTQAEAIAAEVMPFAIMTWKS